jgi:hypothetical protein
MFQNICATYSQEEESKSIAAYTNLETHVTFHVLIRRRPDPYTTLYTEISENLLFTLQHTRDVTKSKIIFRNSCNL